ncbi:MAG: hypothetical protein LUD72_01895, partial [Bacteroidales bacterium]|nr:hypothetical protein [Bacteroidales bacterium]
MKYDEFVDHDDAMKYNDTVELMYYFDELDIEPEEAEEAGFGDRYDYLAPRKDVEAVMKYFLVHEEKMKPEGASEEYIKKNFENLFDRYGEKII